MIHDQCLFPPMGCPSEMVAPTKSEWQASETAPITVPVKVSVLWVISLIARTRVAPDLPGLGDGALYYSLVSMFRSSP